MQKITKAELGDAVILDADSNSVSSSYDDLGSIPTKAVSLCLVTQQFNVH